MIFRFFLHENIAYSVRKQNELLVLENLEYSGNIKLTILVATL